MNVEAEKRLAAYAAAQLVSDDMMVGLGTGSTVAYLLVALGEARVAARYVASSPRTEAAARALGLVVEPFDTIERLDLAIDGADQIADSGWLIKGGGGAHTREKIVCAAAARYVVIADSTKVVERLHAPVPLELLSYGIESTLALLGTASRRDLPGTPDGGVLAEYLGEIENPRTLAARLADTPGVIDHGLFAPELVSEVYVGIGKTVRRTTSGGDE